jgi:hypothetical protein
VQNVLNAGDVITPIVQEVEAPHRQSFVYSSSIEKCELSLEVPINVREIIGEQPENGPILT